MFFISFLSSFFFTANLGVAETLLTTGTLLVDLLGTGFDEFDEFVGNGGDLVVDGTVDGNDGTVVDVGIVVVDVDVVNEIDVGGNEEMEGEEDIVVDDVINDENDETDETDETDEADDLLGDGSGDVEYENDENGGIDDDEEDEEGDGKETKEANDGEGDNDGDMHGDAVMDRDGDVDADRESDKGDKVPVVVVFSLSDFSFIFSVGFLVDDGIDGMDDGMDDEIDDEIDGLNDGFICVVIFNDFGG